MCYDYFDKKSFKKLYIHFSGRVVGNSSQTEDFKVVIYCFFAKQAAYVRFTRSLSGATCHSVCCCFCKLAQKGPTQHVRKQGILLWSTFLVLKCMK